MNNRPKPEQPPETSKTSAHKVLPRWGSDALLNGAREAIIEHLGQEYRLRVTGQGKLLLTK
jgi:hemin uptake protein HemP